MSCWQPERWRAALSALIDGEDPPIPRVQVEAHLAECDDCSRWYAEASAHAAALRRDPGPVRDLSAHLIGVAESHICGCHVGQECLCTNCVCPSCTCQVG